jgi:16S rRNA G1207 methylase RsmC
VIAAHLPRGTTLAEHLLRAAGAALRDGGRLYLLGHKLTGIKTFVDRMEQIFGAAHTWRSRPATAWRSRPGTACSRPRQVPGSRAR